MRFNFSKILSANNEKDFINLLFCEIYAYVSYFITMDMMATRKEVLTYSVLN